MTGAETNPRRSRLGKPSLGQHNSTNADRALRHKVPSGTHDSVSVWFADKCNLWEETMKKFVTMIVALGLAVAFAGPTFAADAPKTKADCEKAKMKWDDTAKKCSK